MIGAIVLYREKSGGKSSRAFWVDQGRIGLGSVSGRSRVNVGSMISNSSTAVSKKKSEWKLPAVPTREAAFWNMGRGKWRKMSNMSNNGLCDDMRIDAGGAEVKKRRAG